MYRYEYERVELDGSGWNPFGGFGLTSEQYREVVNHRAAEGWRFITVVPLESRANGMLESIDLVFEKETE